jgi:hypothetical protein
VEELKVSMSQLEKVKHASSGSDEKLRQEYDTLREAFHATAKEVDHTWRWFDVVGAVE